MVDSTQVQH